MRNTKGRGANWQPLPLVRPRTVLRVCQHGFHHPYPDNLDYPHSCDGCWCEGERDRRDYGWPHNTTPKEPHA